MRRARFVTFRRPRRLIDRELTKVVAKTIRRAAVKSGPERGFAHGGATGRHHRRDGPDPQHERRDRRYGEVEIAMAHAVS